uniref:EGF-like domain-containing protein n=1 Tax=Strongyloides papillosus TaxID=174720 RepID=A0A0N5BZ69_STREA
MNTTIEYQINDGLSERTIKFSHDLLERETCLNFTRSYGQSTSATVIRRGIKCSASAEIRNRKIYYHINVNDSCMERDMIQRLIYWSTDMRYQITKCLYKYRTSEFLADSIIDLLTHYYCEFVNPRETTVDINDNLLEFSGLKSPKSYGIDPSNLEQRDYSAEISFCDVKSLNENICKNSCAGKSCKKYKNYGYANPRNCEQTICPFFFNGTYCDKLMTPKRPDYCGNPSLTATSGKKFHVLDLNTECFYKIKSSSKSKKVKVKFTPIVSDAHWDCKRYKILEIKYNTDKSKDGVMPCGKMKEFTVKGSKGADILVYHYKIAQEFKIKMEYQVVSK